MVWMRPNNMSYPMVWRRFQRTLPDGSTLKFKIQDGTKEMQEDLMDFMVKYFMRDETLNKAIGIEHEELAIKEFYELQSSYFDENLMILCLPDDDIHYDMINKRPPILGFNLMYVGKKNEPRPKKKALSKAITKLFQVFSELERVDDVFERFNVTEYLSDAGISIHPDFRGLGISHEIVKARNQLCKAAGFKVSALACTGLVSQKCAEKGGYKTYQKVPYSRLEQITNIEFNSSSEFVTLMAYLTDTETTDEKN